MTSTLLGVDMSKLDKGVTKQGKPRIRRERLSKHVRMIEHNVFIHIKRDVRHTGRGWMPLLLDPAWDAALRRMLKEGIVLERPDLGGYVPAEFAPRMERENEVVLGMVKRAQGRSKKPVHIKVAAGRERAQALGRLVVSGKVDFDPELGYSVNA